MRTLPLCGPVVAAVSLVADGAQALDGGMKLSTGEHVATAQELGSENGARNHARHQRRSDWLNVGNGIQFKPEATLDNGLIMGAHVDLSGVADLDLIDERWIYLQAGWGELRIGVIEDARKLKSSAPVRPADKFEITSPFSTFGSNPDQVVSTVSTTRDTAAEAGKLIYFTPTFGGFQVAVSYASGDYEDHTGLGTDNSVGWHRGAYDRGELGTDTLDQARFGASYAFDAGVSIDAMVGYANYNCETCSDNKGWQTVIGAAIVF